VIEAFSSEPFGFNDSDVRSLNLLGELILAAIRPEERRPVGRTSDSGRAPSRASGAEKEGESALNVRAATAQPAELLWTRICSAQLPGNPPAAALKNSGRCRNTIATRIQLSEKNQTAAGSGTMDFEHCPHRAFGDHCDRTRRGTVGKLEYSAC